MDCRAYALPGSLFRNSQLDDGLVMIKEHMLSDRKAAELACLAYKRDDEHTADWQSRLIDDVPAAACLEFLDTFQHEDNCGFTCGSDSDFVVVYRGTDKAPDWVTNLDSTQIHPRGGDFLGKVHRGFHDAAHGLWGHGGLHRILYDQSKVQKKRIHSVGHSLGGAMAACVAAIAFRQDITSTTVQTFGQPRFGNRQLANIVTTVFNARYRRHVNCTDPVPWTPPAYYLVPMLLGKAPRFYAHGGHQIYYDHEGLRHVNPSATWAWWDRSRKLKEDKSLIKHHAMGRYLELVKHNEDK